jgi:hypothetical protein
LPAKVLALPDLPGKLWDWLFAAVEPAVVCQIFASDSFGEETSMKRYERNTCGLVLLLSLTLGASHTHAQKPVEPKASAKTPAQAPAKTATAKAAPLEVPQLKFEKYKLDNGLEVILSEDHRLPMVAVNLWYHVGPANELPGRTGFAHLFEHMMFEGSRHVPGSSHFHLLEAAGASDINGTTDFDRTNYFETLPSNQLELALWLQPIFRTSKTLCGTNGGKASKMPRTGSWKRGCSTSCFPSSIRTTRM